MLRIFLFLWLTAAVMPAADVLIRTTEGVWMEGTAAIPKTPVPKLLSMHNGSAASPAEVVKIEAGLKALQEKDRAARDIAVEELSYIGLPVLTPMLEVIRDTDQHEPKPLYNLFSRLLPSTADQLDRTASLYRGKGGVTARGAWPQGELKLTTRNGVSNVAWSQIRIFAVRQKTLARVVEVHSLRNSTQIEYLDTGIHVGAAGSLQLTAKGFTRLSWKDDSWAAGPNGISKPGGNYKTNLVDGHPFGALLGRIGAKGGVFFVGEKASKSEMLPGNLQLAINDNAHWQNNLGSHVVTIAAMNAYDLSEAR